MVQPSKDLVTGSKIKQDHIPFLIAYYTRWFYTVTYKNNQRGICEFTQQFLFSSRRPPKETFLMNCHLIFDKTFAEHECLLFSYSVSNSGKTHTILGTRLA